jgi:hypothetical protein
VLDDGSHRSATPRVGTRESRERQGRKSDQGACTRSRARAGDARPNAGGILIADLRSGGFTSRRPTADTVNRSLHVVTYNIHKGLSLFNRRVVIHELRDRLRTLGADIVFLQEVLGTHERHAERHEEWPAEPQYEFLADTVWADFAYG